MHYEIQPRAKKTLAERHIDDLIEVLGELLTVPELRCFPSDEMFDSTRETMAGPRHPRRRPRRTRADGRCAMTKPNHQR